jgi:hypothetical protein
MLVTVLTLCVVGFPTFAPLVTWSFDCTGSRFCRGVPTVSPEAAVAIGRAVTTAGTHILYAPDYRQGSICAFNVLRR